MWSGLVVDGKSETTAYTGSYANAVLTNIDVENVCVGYVLCDIGKPIPVTNKFEAKIVIFDIVYPVTMGYSVGFKNF